MTQSKFAEKIGVSRQAVSKMKKEGILIFKNGKIDEAKTILNLEKLGRLKKGKKVNREITDTEIEEYSKMRIQLIKEQVKKVKLSNEEKEGSLIKVDEAKMLLGKFLNPIVQDMDFLSQDFKNTFPTAPNEMLEYLSDYIEKIKIKSQSNALL